MLLAIDSGACSGWALFVGGVLRACGLNEPPDDLDSPWLYSTEKADINNPLAVVIECPQLRPRGEKNPNSILLVARSAGEWGGRYKAVGADVSYVTPNDWKGSSPKEIDHRRTFAKLSPEELQALVLGCKGLSPRSAPIDKAVRVGLSKSDVRANLMDAVGIGLWSVGRGSR